MTPQELVRDLRIAAMTTPHIPSPASIHDKEAEELYLASRCVGFCSVKDVPWPDFYSRFHQEIALAFEAGSSIGVQPTPDEVVTALRGRGMRGPHLQRAVERLMIHMPASSIGLDAAAHTIRRCAWIRRLINAIDRLRGLALVPSISDEELGAEIDRLIVVGAEQPTSPECQTWVAP